MSAVPKKRLCWNCEGNVSKEADNCPYCGVYVHSIDSDSSSFWGPSYHPSEKEEEIPAPLYRENREEKTSLIEALEPDRNEDTVVSFSVLEHLKKDIFPIVFLMAGSVFFLFGLVLFLFADQDGKLILEWNGNNRIYFLGLSFPLFFFGLKFLKKIDS